MSRSTSLLLDLLRICAAATVFAAHAYWILYNHPYEHRLPIPAHDAVIVFFVLSGYVIAFSTLNRRNAGPVAYTIARLTRLYSVVLPAIILTLILGCVGQHIRPDSYPAGADLGRLVMTTLFLQSSWSLALSPKTDSPFWSLGYEFWYYAVFGVLLFVKPWKWRLAGIVFCLAMTGTNIILLGPIWAFGAFAYLWRDYSALTPKVARIGLILLLPISFVIAAMPELPQKVPLPPLLCSASFGKDWLLGMAICAVIWLFNRAYPTLMISPKLEAPVRWASNHTFSLYLFHVPLMLFLVATGLLSSYGWKENILKTLLVLLIIVILGELTEMKRKILQKWLNRRFGQKLDPRTAKRPS